jgi:hypothetical protein
MDFDLEQLAPALERRAGAWTSLGVEWAVEPVAPNHGKPVVVARFESVSWLGDVMIWITGEAELSTARLADNWMVNKHYDLLGPGDLEALLEDLIGIVDRGEFPPGAVTA